MVVLAVLAVDVFCKDFPCILAYKKVQNTARNYEFDYWAGMFPAEKLWLWIAALRLHEGTE